MPILAATGLYNPQVVDRHHHCVAEAGSLQALYCPAPAAPAELASHGAAWCGRDVPFPKEEGLSPHVEKESPSLCRDGHLREASHDHHATVPSGPQRGSGSRLTPWIAY
jgi:hypothetical protein